METIYRYVIRLLPGHIIPERYFGNPHVAIVYAVRNFPGKNFAIETVDGHLVFKGEFFKV